MKKIFFLGIISLLSITFVLVPLGDNNNKAHADLLYAWVDDVTVHTVLNPPNPMYYETTIFGTKMAGWLSRTPRLVGNGIQEAWVYEGYLYNKKNPIPGPFKVITEEAS